MLATQRAGAQPPAPQPHAARAAVPNGAASRSAVRAVQRSVPYGAASAAAGAAPAPAAAPVFIPAPQSGAGAESAVRPTSATVTATASAASALSSGPTPASLTAPHPSAYPLHARDSASGANPVTVAVLAGDPITGQGAVAYLRSRAEVKIVSVDRQHEAEVVLVIVDTVTEDTLKLMERAADASVNKDARFVLVGNGVREHHVLRAITCGLVSVIPRREADFEHVLRAVTEVREGRLEMPGVALGWLVGQLRAIQQDVLEPNGLTAAGLETREVDVLRLLAEGLGTPEIAARLNYSERTVKNIIHGVLTRLKLRNRAHAVAFAVRSGAL